MQIILLLKYFGILQIGLESTNKTAARSEWPLLSYKWLQLSYFVAIPNNKKQCSNVILSLTKRKKSYCPNSRAKGYLEACNWFLFFMFSCDVPVLFSCVFYFCSVVINCSIVSNISPNEQGSKQYMIKW